MFQIKYKISVRIGLMLRLVDWKKILKKECPESCMTILFGIPNFQVIPFKTQARNYKKVAVFLRNNLGRSEAKLLLSNAVYMFSIGANDYLSPFLTHSDVLNSYSDSEYVAMVVRNMTSIIKVQT